MLVLHFDYCSAASAVAVLRLQRIADEGLAVGFQGLDALGVDAVLPVTLDQLAEVEQVRAQAAELGLILRRPTRRPPTLAAHLVSEVAESYGLGASWRTRCLDAYWSDDVDLSDNTTLLALAEQSGLPSGEVAALLADRPRRAALRARMAQSRRRGVGGVPVLEHDGTLVPVTLPDVDLRALAAL